MALSRAAASSGGRRPHTWRRRAVRAAGAVAAGAALSSATPARAAKKAPAASAEPDMIETAMIIGVRARPAAAAAGRRGARGRDGSARFVSSPPGANAPAPAPGGEGGAARGAARGGGVWAVPGAPPPVASRAEAERWSSRAPAPQTKFVKECGLSGVVGLAAGMALKSALSLLAVGVAGVFAVGLWLELNGLITIHRDRFGPWLANQTKILDLNNDGVFDAKDVKIAKAKAMGFITQSLPSAGGFATGFMTGLRF